MAKVKDKERFRKTTGEKQRVVYKGITIKLSSDFSAGTLQARREWHDILKLLKWKNLQPRYSTKRVVASYLKLNER